MNTNNKTSRGSVLKSAFTIIELVVILCILCAVAFIAISIIKVTFHAMVWIGMGLLALLAIITLFK